MTRKVQKGASQSPPEGPHQALLKYRFLGRTQRGSDPEGLRQGQRMCNYNKFRNDSSKCWSVDHTWRSSPSICFNLCTQLSLKFSFYNKGFNNRHSTIYSNSLGLQHQKRGPRSQMAWPVGLCSVLIPSFFKLLIQLWSLRLHFYLYLCFPTK